MSRLPMLFLLCQQHCSRARTELIAQHLWLLQRLARCYGCWPRGVHAVEGTHRSHCAGLALQEL